MAKNLRLKVFRHSIGFHDAYVAASSQKDALAAWGAQTDLFASGMAERVEDPDLMREPLANPGKIIRRSRGSNEEQLAALPPDPSRKAGARTTTMPETGKNPARKSMPRPDHSVVERAERKMAVLEKRHRTERDALAKRQADLDRERSTLETAQQAETAKAANALDRARSSYDRAISTRKAATPA